MIQSTELQRICQDHLYFFSDYKVITEESRKIPIPVCTQHQDSCRYAGQHIDGTCICEGQLMYDRDIADIIEGDDFMMKL